MYKYSFNGKEKDDEVKGAGNSYDYGARIYDPRLGRWLSIDPKFGSYQSVGPFTFTNDNPIIFTDPDGRKVKPLSQEARDILLLSLTPEEAKFVKFNRKGFVKEGSLKRGERKLDNVGGNYEALLSLVKEKQIYEVEINDHIEVHKIKGDPKTLEIIPFGNVEYRSEADDEWQYVYQDKYEKQGKAKVDFIKEHPELSTELEPVGTLGESTYGDESGGHGYSASGNNRAVINAGLTTRDKVKLLAHELYGHTLFKAKGKDHAHRADRKSVV